MSNRIRKRSQLQEKRAANDIGGRTVAGSGAAKFSGGGDVRKQGELRVECKFTEKNFYDLKLQDLKKIKLQALKGGLEQPVLQLEFIIGLGSTKYSVVPDIPKDIPQLKVTSKKQIRINRADLLQHLHRPGNEEGVQVTFLEGVKSIPHTFTINRWAAFLNDLDRGE